MITRRSIPTMTARIRRRGQRASRIAPALMACVPNLPVNTDLLPCLFYCYVHFWSVL